MDAKAIEFDFRKAVLTCLLTAPLPVQTSCHYTSVTYCIVLQLTVSAVIWQDAVFMCISHLQYF